MHHPFTHHPPIERSWDGDAFRNVDTSLRTLVVLMARALGGLTASPSRRSCATCRTRSTWARPRATPSA